MDSSTPSDNTAHYSSLSQRIAKMLRRVLSKFLNIFPPNAPQFIYTVILRPRPLRALTNFILRRMIPTEIQIPEGILILNPDDPVVSGALMLGVYEKSFTHIFRSTVKEGMTIVDIGANIGYYTLIGASHVGAKGRVIAFEPEVTNASILDRMIKKNGLTHVTRSGFALGDHEEKRKLYLDPDNKGKHTLLPVSGNHTADISSTTLDIFLNTHQITRVDLIKMDIEGWEAKAFRGMRETLKKDTPEIFFEFAPERIRETGEDPVLCLSSLGDLGYTLAYINEQTAELVPITDIPHFIMSLSGYDGYVNIRASQS